MSTVVNWNGTAYTIPASGEVSWGTSLSAFLVALGNNAAVAQEMKQAIRVATSSPITVSATTDFTICSKLSVAGAVAVNLPAGVDGQIFVIFDGTGDAGSNNITITPNGAETINGAATLVLNHNRQSVTLQYTTTGTDWKVLDNVIYPGTISLTSDVTGVLPPANGGTGVANNAASTLTISGNYATTLTVSNTTGVTLPTTGTLATLAGSETFTNKTLTTPTISSPTVTGTLLLQNPSGAQPELALSEDPDNGTNKVTLKAAAAMGSDYAITLPDAVPAGNGYALTSTTGGVSSWTSVLTNPMDSAGDMIVGGASGTPTKLDSGSSGQWLLSAGAASPTWTNTTTTGKTIDGSADEIQLVVQGNGTQTSDILVVEKSDGTDLLQVTNTAGTAIRGTTTNDSASSGYVGEEQKQTKLESAASAFSSGTATNITASALSLTAGDWDIDAIGAYQAGSGDTITNVVLGVSTTSATQPASSDTYGVANSSGEIKIARLISITANNRDAIVIPPYRVTLTATTSFYLVGTVTHSGGNAIMYGSIRARRIR